jgi:hypothetical protein
MKRFLQRFASLVAGILHGFDRLRFRGSKRQLAYASGLFAWLNFCRIPLKQYKSFARDTTESLCRSIETAAQEAGHFQYLNNSQQSKEETALAMAQRLGRSEGLIAVLACVEPCQTMQVRGNRDTKRLELRSEPSKCKHYYHYYLDPVYGLRYTRLQSWFPFTMHVGLNGREWLACQMTQAGIAYEQRDNCFSWVSDFAAAQALANRQLTTAWPELLDGWAHESCPWLFGEGLRGSLPYYWSLQEGEYATDIAFGKAADLQRLYPTLVRHALTTLHGADVLRFLGYRVRKDGQPRVNLSEEVTTRLKERVEGTCVKHRAAGNLLKMYDKFEQVLRIESLLLNVKDFKVYRAVAPGEEGKPGYYRLRQGVSDLHRYAEVCEKINARYAEGLASVAEPKPLGELTASLGRRRQENGRSIRALNPLAAADVALLEAISAGEYAISGFRNRDVRARLYGEASAGEKKKQGAKVTRLLRLLRDHGLIVKVAKTHRYHLSDHGRQCVAALLTARQANTSQLLQAA